MREFRLSTVMLDSWPLLNRPWTSLVTLYLFQVEVARDDGFASLGAPGMLPNLHNFEMDSCGMAPFSQRKATAVLMPDLRCFQRLESVRLSDMTLRLSLCNLPFPCGLQKLLIKDLNRAVVASITSSVLVDAIKKNLPNCEIKVLQGGTSAEIVGWVDLDLGSSPASRPLLKL